MGRDTQALDEAEITRGAVETVAENTVDGITSPLLFALLGGAPLALAYKAINTLDSMVGYRNERYGDSRYASARLDDLANWLPAWLTALCLWLAGVLWLRFTAHPALAGRSGGHLARSTPPSSPQRGLARGDGGEFAGRPVGRHQRLPGRHTGPRWAPPILKASHITTTIWLMHGAWLMFFLLLFFPQLYFVMATGPGDARPARQPTLDHWPSHGGQAAALLQRLACLPTTRWKISAPT